MPDDAEPTVGARLRRRRQAQRLTLNAVSTRAGLTEGYLSQVERDKARASVRTLQRLCDVLHLQVGDLFAQQHHAEAAVLRFRDMTGFGFGERATKMRLTPSSFDHLQVLLGLFEPGGSTGVDPYTHGDSEEVVVALDGDVIVTVGDTEHRLGALDSLAYHSSQPHRVAEATGRDPARVLWAIAPPTY